MSNQRTTERILPKSGRGDTILLDDGRAIELRTVIRKYNCSAASDDERRYGCYWVVGDDDNEYVVTADVSGRYSRTFKTCSNSR